MKERKIYIKSIQNNSIAEEVGIEKGDFLLTVNNCTIKDIFDYRFQITNESIIVEIQKQDGEVWEIEIDKEEYEDLGIEFEQGMLDSAKSCTNKCIFCFIDQLPEGMRNTLYFKDDDSRLSFLMGNYITLTNMSEDDIDRIIKYRMSPVNVSVHTTSPELRVFMLKNKFAGDLMDKIKRLVNGGICINCQIVICRDINDGKFLDKSIEDLSSLYPGVNSISIVPVGITKYRKGLEHLKAFDFDSSNKVIRQVEAWQLNLLDKFDSRIVYLADEFYIMSELELPEFECYEDFPQIENGVGLISMLKHEFYEYLNTMDVNDKIIKDKLYNRSVSIATGVSSYKYIKNLADELENRYNSIKINVYEIENEFFGKNVTVTGLITGGDLISQLKNKELGDDLLISISMLKDGEKIFLDDIKLDDIEKELNVTIKVVENDGKDFIRKILRKSN